MIIYVCIHIARNNKVRGCAQPGRSEVVVRGGYKRDAVRRDATRTPAALGLSSHSAPRSCAPLRSLDRRSEGRKERRTRKPIHICKKVSILFANYALLIFTVSLYFSHREMFSKLISTSIFLIVIANTMFRVARAAVASDHRQQQVSVFLLFEYF